MASQERLSDYLFPRPRERGADDPRTRRPAERPDSFWGRHLRPPSALVLAVVVTVVAVTVAFVATVIYANVDAGRPLAPETAAPPPTSPDPQPGVVEPEAGEPTPTTTPEILTPELIAEKLRESVWSVSSFDVAGGRTEGSAFVAGSFGGRTLLVTSLSVVGAATREPAPAITIGQDGRSADATLWTWHEESDLALLVTDLSSPGLPLGIGAPVERGDRIYAMAAARPLSPGIVTGVAADGVDHNIFVEAPLQGAPMVNERGQVVAVLSAAYNPGGRATTTTFVGVPIARACGPVLDCGGGNVDPESPGASSGPSTTTAARD